MSERTSVPERCDKPGVGYTYNGYRFCEAHRVPSVAALTPPTEGTWGSGRCDFPLDGLAAARLTQRKAYESEARMLGGRKPIVISI